MSKDDLGDRMKAYERTYTDSSVPIEEILCVRIDGKNFSRYTKGYTKPFDSVLQRSFEFVTLSLMKETHAFLGYTQSDEITLIYLPTEKSSEYFFGGKVQKISSVLASMATAYFNAAMHPAPIAFFDCRAFGVPSKAEASNVLYWRMLDARRNAVSSAFRHTHGHKAMQGLSCKEMESMLDMDKYSHKSRYGSLMNKDSELSAKLFLELDFQSKMKYVGMYEEETV